MRRRIGWISSLTVVGLAAAVIGIVVATSSAGSDPASGLNAFEHGTPAKIDSGLVEHLRSQDVDISGNDAVAVKPVDGDSSWTLAEGADDVCLVRSADGANVVSCGPKTNLRRGAIVSFTPNEQAAESLGIPKKFEANTVARAKPSTPTGSATFQGVAANDVTEAAAVTADGKVLRSSKVVDNVFVLADVPFAEVANIRLTRENGETSVQPAAAGR